MAAGRKRSGKRRIKGMPGVRLPLPRQRHQRHADRRLKPPRHRRKPEEE